MSEQRKEFENERVRVWRVRVDANASHSPLPRSDRVVVFLTAAQHLRKQTNSVPEIIHRQPGEVVWRDASEHQVENGGSEHELIIVELKDPV